MNALDYQHHYVSSIIVEDVVTGDVMDNCILRPKLSNIPVEEFYEWSPEEDGHMLVSIRDSLKRSSKQKFPELFKNVNVSNHVQHQFSQDFSKPINQYCGKLYFEPETCEGMDKILNDMVENYVVKAEFDEKLFDDELFQISGDYKTAALGSKSIDRSVDDVNQRAGFFLTHDYFHLEFCILQSILKIFRSKDSISLDGSFIRFATELNRRKVANKDAKDCYHEIHDFVLLLHDGILAEIIRKKLDCDSVDSIKNEKFNNKQEMDTFFEEITKEFLPFLRDSNSSLKLPNYYPLQDYLKQNENTTDSNLNSNLGSSESLSTDSIVSNSSSCHDYVLGYYTQLFTLTTIYKLFHESTKHGDGLLAMLIQKFLLRVFYATGRTNYTSSIIHFLANIYSTNKPSESMRLLHNRYCNISGGNGTCIAKDMAMENKIRHLKKSLRGLGRNVNVKTITRLNKSSDEVERLISILKKSCNIKKRAKKRTEKDLSVDFIKITSKLKELNVMEFQSGRTFGQFKLSENIFHDQNDAKFITHLKKKIISIEKKCLNN